MSKYIYMAGLMDGEGTVGISYINNKIYRSPYISITSTTPEIIEWLVSNFGGRAQSQKTYKEHYKQSWSWNIRKWEDIENVLTNILPYMLEPEKIRRANLLLSDYKSVTKRNGKYNEMERERKLAFEQNFLSLRGRGGIEAPS